jgi:hypothetical protein
MLIIINNELQNNLKHKVTLYHQRRNLLISYNIYLSIQKFDIIVVHFNKMNFFTSLKSLDIN